MSTLARDAAVAMTRERVLCRVCGSEVGQGEFCSACGARLETDAHDQRPHVFISYRRADTFGHAMLLYDRLKKRFGEDRVFLDVAVLRPGMNWRNQINAHSAAPGVLIALIGPQWLQITQSLAQRSVVEAVDDVARHEIEHALTNSADIELVPVLVDNTTMPPAHELPRSLQALSDRQAEQLRQATYEEDLERLIGRLEQISTAPPPRVGGGRGGSGELTDAKIRPQTTSHHQRVADWMSGDRQVVVVLGSGVSAGCDGGPSAARLAADLAQRFSYAPASERLHLAEVAEYVAITLGMPDLYQSLKEKLGVACQPREVHRFFATFPSTLERLGKPRRHQLIVTTDYDMVLERAFADAGEPFDLAVYTASTGGFVHIPWEGQPAAIAEPNRYHEFPIGDDLELTRTLIVKIHGALEGQDAAYVGEENCVVTEDNYIDYLSGRAIEEIVPFQILQTLRSSHCLLLGYDIRDWSLRVFLKRVWGSRFRAKSWAVQEDADEFAQFLWNECGAELVREPLDEYVEALMVCLEA